MSIRNKTLSAISSITKKLPYHRKLNKSYSFISLIYLKTGTSPLATANMKDHPKMIVNLNTKIKRNSFYTGKYDSDLIYIIQNLFFLDVRANIDFYSASQQ